MGGTGHPSVSAAGGPDGGPTRKRNVTAAGLDSSPGSVDVDDLEDIDNREEKKRQPVKRACNECRQQKVSLRSSRLLSSLYPGGSRSNS